MNIEISPLGFTESLNNRDKQTLETKVVKNYCNQAMFANSDKKKVEGAQKVLLCNQLLGSEKSKEIKINFEVK